MNRFVTALLLVIFTLTACGSGSEQDASEYIKSEYSSQVVKITKPSNPGAGGTGFELRMPSGKVMTVTNSHVCRLQEGGFVDVWREGSSYPTRSRVVIEAVDTDLCLVEGLPAASGLEAARKFNSAKRVYVLGHPLLKALTISSGFPVERKGYDVIDGEADENCQGPGRRKETIQRSIFVLEVCIRKVDAWDTNAPSLPGSSGSPIMNKDGYVVGVLFAGNSETNSSLIIPLDVLNEFISAY